MHLGFSRIGVMVVLGLAVLSGASRALGDDAGEWQFQQFTPAGGFDMWLGRRSGFRPPLSERDLDAIADGLGLDASQREALQDLNASLIDEFKVAWLAYRESSVDADLEREAESGEQQFSWGAGQIVAAERREALDAEQRRLVDTLFADLRLLLTPEQEQRWPEVERDRRRATTIAAFALHDEEALDLVSIVRGLGLTAEQMEPIRTVVGQYADQIDVALADRSRQAEQVGEAGWAYFRDEQEAQTMTRGGDAQEAMEKRMRFWEERQQRAAALVPDALALKAACDRVRDCNRRFASEIGALIPESAREDWTKAVTAKRPSMFASMDNLSKASQSISMMLHLQQQLSSFETWASEGGGELEFIQILRSAEPLSAEQHAAITSLQERHTARAEAIKAARASDTAAGAEPNVLALQTPKGTMMLRRAGSENTRTTYYGFPGQEQPSPELIKDLRRLDMETLKELRGLLTRNQRLAISLW